MATELKPPYVIPCTATELDEAIENSHTHPNKTDLDAIGTAALRDVGTDVGQVPVVGEDGKIDPSLTPETYVHPATHPTSMIDGLDTILDDKVDKVEGKDLSTNDYTTAEKAKLAGIATGANNYVHPSTHPSTMITGLGTAATKNTGTVSGSIPLIGSDGLLPTSVLPPPLTVENVLTSTSTVNALSAAQGKMLADQIDGLTASDITYEGTDLNSALLTLDSRVLAAQTDAQGALAGITSLQTTIGDIGTILDSINGEVV